LVEPNPLISGDKYAVLRMILFDSMNRILWARKVYKSVKTAVESATDYEAIDPDKIRGLLHSRVYVIVEKLLGSIERAES